MPTILGQMAQRPAPVGTSCIHMIRRRHRQGKKRHPDSIYEVEPVDFPGRRNDRRDCKVSIKNAPRSKSLCRRFVNSFLKSFRKKWGNL